VQGVKLILAQEVKLEIARLSTEFPTNVLKTARDSSDL
jgi:hypothetical protein